MVVVGVGKGLSNSYLLSIATRGNQILKLRDLRELFPGSAAHKILVDLLRDPDYGKDYIQNFYLSDLTINTFKQVLAALSGVKKAL